MNNKVLVLNSSPRKKGVTAELAAALTEILEQKDMEVHTEHVYDLKVKPCLGCLQCRPDRTCILPEDDAPRIARLIDGSDTLVLASPTYWGNIPGPLKTLIDRLVPVFEYIDPKTTRISRKLQQCADGSESGGL